MVEDTGPAELVDIGSTTLWLEAVVATDEVELKETTADDETTVDDETTRDELVDEPI